MRDIETISHSIAIGREVSSEPDRSARHQLGYPDDLNAAQALLGDCSPRGRGPRPAFRTMQGPVTYAQLEQRVHAVAAGLARRGVKPGDRVWIVMPNGLEAAVGWLAVLRLGAVAVCLVPGLGPSELEQIHEDTEPSATLTDAPRAALVAASAPGALHFVAHVAGGDTPVEGALDFDELWSAPATPPPACTNPESVALIAYTSGSTGRQKGTVHTHGDVLAIADAYAAEVLSPQASDVFYCHAPLGFTYALGALLIFPLRFGACALLTADAFRPAALGPMLRDHGLSCVFLSPTALRLVLKHPVASDPGTWQGVRRLVTAGEKLDSDTFHAFRNATGLEPVEGIGSTEMLHIWVSQRHGEARGGCVGRPVSLYAVRLVDSSGTDVPEGMSGEGELWVKGPTGCRYWQRPAQQRETVVDGWTRTRDRFLRDERGHYWHLGRVDDLIVTGGYNVAPVEVEMVLRRHPAVQEAAVVGTPSELDGQSVVAFVVADDPRLDERSLARELRQLVKDALAPFKIPRAIVRVDQLPRTVTGKMDRRALVERAPDMVKRRGDKSASSRTPLAPTDEGE